jgi:replicative DNA helicase
LRLGQIDDNEWDRISRAFGRLSEAPIYIDDASTSNIMDVRSKARRLQAEHGLDLIIVDYLQLMTARRTENRVQEISEISRGLKGLARELNVPVVALSQLSRAVESRSDHRPMLSDLRESGCLAGSTPVFLPDSGEYRMIGDLCGQSGFNVLAIDPETWKLTPRRVTAAFRTGRKPVLRLTTRLGRTIRATGNHQFLTIQGWQRLDTIPKGMRIALPTPAALDSWKVSLPGACRGDARVARVAMLDRYDVATDVIDRVRRESIQTRRITHANPRVEELAAAIVETAVSIPDTATVARMWPPALVNRANGGWGQRATQASPLRRFLESGREVVWDEVTSIEPDGEDDVYDLTVEGLHNFVAADIVVHNSIEQDADIVVFIYREDKYDDDSEKKGIAEIMVAKHRNGPVGSINLRFFDRTARFADLELYPGPGM